MRPVGEGEKFSFRPGLCFGVVLHDKAARTAHKIEAHQFAPVVNVLAMFKRCKCPGTTLVFANKLCFTA